MIERGKKIAIGAIVLLGVGVAAFALDPDKLSVLPACPLHHFTGWWCPGCGGTRAVHQLAHGNFVAAFRFNPLAILLLPLGVYWVMRGDRHEVKPVWFWTILSVAIVFGILRNIPVYPFTLLAP